jgi:hypothetical protein
MGRLLHLRRGRSPLHAVEETIAALHEELEFTTNFAHAMVREENYHAAATVIDEQRRSLVRASQRIERALRAPEIERNRMRTRAALAGLAAVLALGTGAFATFGPRSAPPTSERIQAIQDASVALDAAVEMSDPVALTQIVGGAQEQILQAAQTAAVGDPEVKATLLDSVKKLQKAIANPNLPAKVRARAQEVAEKVQEIVVAEPETVSEPAEEEAPSETPSEAPAAPAAP